MGKVFFLFNHITPHTSFNLMVGGCINLILMGKEKTKITTNYQLASLRVLNSSASDHLTGLSNSYLSKGYYCRPNHMHLLLIVTTLEKYIIIAETHLYLLHLFLSNQQSPSIFLSVLSLNLRTFYKMSSIDCQ